VGGGRGGGRGRMVAAQVKTWFPGGGVLAGLDPRTPGSEMGPLLQCTGYLLRVRVLASFISVTSAFIKWLQVRYKWLQVRYKWF
jgi:hypothetical protein